MEKNYRIYLTVPYGEPRRNYFNMDRTTIRYASEAYRAMRRGGMCAGVARDYVLLLLLGNVEARNRLLESPGS